MPTMRRAALAGLVILLVAATARAQTEPPPAMSPPPPSTTPGAPPAPAAPPAPVAPLPSTLAPEPTQGPPLQLSERSPLEQQPPRPEPFYRQSWFWAVFGVAFVTSFIITFAILRDKASGPPDTTFGNMHAF